MVGFLTPHPIHRGPTDEIFARFGRYVTFDPSTVRVREVNGAAVCTLVIDLEMPKRFQSTAMAAIGAVRARQGATHSTRVLTGSWHFETPGELTLAG
jgi:hypothetical protein